MSDLWDSGPLVTSASQERDVLISTPEQVAQQTVQSPRLNVGTPTVAPEIAVPLAHGLEHAYGPEWQAQYGTMAGRTLTGATPDEAFPAASTPERQQVRDALAATLMPGQSGADHPDVQAALRGALADGMAQPDRAVVNQAALDAAVERNPEALLGQTPDIPREQLVAWRELAMQQMPASMRVSMEAMNGPIRDAHQSAYDIRMQHREPNEIVTSPSPTLWAPLDVRQARGGVVNMDYYPVRVRMPDGVEPGVLLNHIRTHLNDFVDTSKSSFSAYPNQAGGGDNVGRWNSTRPTGSLVNIDIPFNDGTVGVIDSAQDHWTFQTVQSPADGLHPVSGNRAFGYTDNQDGMVTFYTRGVDRITNNGMVAANALSGGQVFEGGDALWRSFQQGVAAYARENGGTATVGDPVIRRPNWSDVDDVLTGREAVRTFYNRQTGR